MSFFDSTGSLVHKHVIEDTEYRFHFLSTAVYQTSEYGGGAYSTNHLICEVNNGKIGFLINFSPSFGNGINKKMQRRDFSSLPSADDLEGSVRNINGNGRDYILEAFVKLTRENVELIGGLVDTTAFFDTNRFANDEVNQFLNTDLVNNPLSLLPSYNIGLILNLNYSIFKVSNAIVDGKPDAETVYLLEVGISEKNYNLSLYYFHAPLCENKGFGVVGDYSFDNLGFFFRWGINSSDEYAYFISGGMTYNAGKHTFGIGFARRKGNKFADVNVGETYYRYRLLTNLHLTFDYQYIDEVKSTYVLGIRVHFEY